MEISSRRAKKQFFELEPKSRRTAPNMGWSILNFSFGPDFYELTCAILKKWKSRFILNEMQNIAWSMHEMCLFIQEEIVQNH